MWCSRFNQSCLTSGGTRVLSGCLETGEEVAFEGQGATLEALVEVHVSVEPQSLAEVGAQAVTQVGWADSSAPY